MKTKDDHRKVALQEAEKICRQLEAQWPGISTEVSLDTQEGEDAYIWVKVPAEQVDAVRVAASGLTAELWGEKGIYIVPRMHIILSLQDDISLRG